MKMKLLASLALVLILSACGSAKKDEAGKLNDKKAELAKLQKQQKDINDKISKLQHEIETLDTTANKNANAKLVAVATIQPGGFNHFIELQGSIDAKNISYVAPPNGQGGVVTALYVTQGQTVHKGQVLA